jgi:hypothetical protein
MPHFFYSLPKKKHFEKLYSKVFCISERMFVAESITIAKNQELKNSELNQ